MTKDNNLEGWRQTTVSWYDYGDIMDIKILRKFEHPRHGLSFEIENRKGYTSSIATKYFGFTPKEDNCYRTQWEGRGLDRGIINCLKVLGVRATPTRRLGRFL